MFIATSAHASLIDPYSQGLQNPASFLVVDDPDSTEPGQVVLSSSSFCCPSAFVWNISAPEFQSGTPTEMATATSAIRLSMGIIR
jgi:hypothetical protein